MSTTTNGPVTTAAFDSSALFEPQNNQNMVVLSGSVTNSASIANLEIRDNGASLGGVGAFQSSNAGWSFTAALAPGSHSISATVTELSGASYTIAAPFQLSAGIQNEPYVYQEIDHSPSGAVSTITSYAQDGTVVGRNRRDGLNINGGSSTGEVLRSASNDVMTGDGSGGSTFVFTRGFGRDEITDFNYLSAAQSENGVEHDVLSLPLAVFQNLAQVFRHTSSALDGDAVIHLSATDSIKLDGVTKSDLITHPNVFRLHA